MLRGFPLGDLLAPLGALLFRGNVDSHNRLETEGQIAEMSRSFYYLATTLGTRARPYVSTERTRTRVLRAFPDKHSLSTVIPQAANRAGLARPVAVTYRA